MPNDFFEKYKLNSRDFMVYCFLVSKKDKKGKSYWSIRKMAEQCNMSYESVRRAIKSLEDQCLIDVEHCSVNGKKIQIFISYFYCFHSKSLLFYVYDYTLYLAKNQVFIDLFVSI